MIRHIVRIFSGVGFGRFAAFGALLFLPQEASAYTPFFQIHQQSLPNGLKVLIYEDHSRPVVTYMTLYEAGPSLAAQRGASLFLPSLLLESPQGPQQSFRQALEGAGILFEADLFHTAAFYSFSGPSSRATDMAAFSARLMRLAPAAAAPFEAVRQKSLAFLEAYNRRYPWQDLLLGMVTTYESRPSAGSPHPYAFAGLADTATAAALSEKDMWAFYRRWYCPAHAVVFISGDIQIAAASKMVRDRYGDLPPCVPNSEEPVPTAGPDMTASEVAPLNRAVAFTLLEPPLGDGRTLGVSERFRGFLRLQLAKQMVRLYLEKTLATRKTASSLVIFAGDLNLFFTPSPLVVGVGVPALTDPEALKNDLQKALEGFSSLNARDLNLYLEEARNRLLIEEAYRTDEAVGRMRFLLTAYKWGFSAERMAGYDSALRNINTAEMRPFLQKILPTEIAAARRVLLEPERLRGSFLEASPPMRISVGGDDGRL